MRRSLALVSPRSIKSMTLETSITSGRSLTTFVRPRRPSGGTHRDRHQAPPKGAHRFLMPISKTLRDVNPKLLSALKTARDKSVNDDELHQSNPISSSQGPTVEDRQLPE